MLIEQWYFEVMLLQHLPDSVKGRGEGEERAGNSWEVLTALSQGSASVCLKDSNLPLLQESFDY